MKTKYEFKEGERVMWDGERSDGKGVTKDIRIGVVVGKSKDKKDCLIVERGGKKKVINKKSLRPAPENAKETPPPEETPAEDETAESQE